jgi:hypothetical protein
MSHSIDETHPDPTRPPRRVRRLLMTLAGVVTLGTAASTVAPAAVEAAVYGPDYTVHQVVVSCDSWTNEVSTTLFAQPSQYPPVLVVGRFYAPYADVALGSEFTISGRPYTQRLSVDGSFRVRVTFWFFVNGQFRSVSEFIPWYQVGRGAQRTSYCNV